MRARPPSPSRCSFAAGRRPAHGRDPEVVTLEEAPDATVTVSVRVDDDPSRVGAAWSFALSPRCRVLDAPARVPEVRGERWRWRVDCGPGASTGVTVDSLGSAHETLVNVRRRDGVRPGPARSARRLPRWWSPTRAPPARPSRWTTARGFVALGVAHLATGLDHLLFLALLLVRVRSWRRRAAAVSSFTAGHALTLCVAALTTVPVSSALVEALIAGSIWLLAADTWRLSASEGDGGLPDPGQHLVSGSPGGLRAGARAGLRGRPPLRGDALRGAGARAGAFNVGIELAQLAAVLAAALMERVAAALAARAWGERR